MRALLRVLLKVERVRITQPFAITLIIQRTTINPYLTFYYLLAYSQNKNRNNMQAWIEWMKAMAK